MQQSDHRHGIGRTDQGAKHQGEGPSPSGKLGHDRSDTHHQQAGQQHRDHQARCRQQDSVDHGFLEDVHVQLIGRIKYQNRQEEIEYQVWMDIDHGINAHRDGRLRPEYAHSIERTHTKAHRKQSHRIGYSRPPKQDT